MSFTHNGNSILCFWSLLFGTALETFLNCLLKLEHWDVLCAVLNLGFLLKSWRLWRWHRGRFALWHLKQEPRSSSRHCDGGVRACLNLSFTPPLPISSSLLGPFTLNWLPLVLTWSIDFLQEVILRRHFSKLSSCSFYTLMWKSVHMCFSWKRSHHFYQNFLKSLRTTISMLQHSPNVNGIIIFMFWHRCSRSSFGRRHE